MQCVQSVPTDPTERRQRRGSARYPQNISTSCKDVGFQRQDGWPPYYPGFKELWEAIYEEIPFCSQARLCSSLASDPVVFVEGVRTPFLASLTDFQVL